MASHSTRFMRRSRWSDTSFPSPWTVSGTYFCDVDGRLLPEVTSVLVAGCPPIESQVRGIVAEAHGHSGYHM